MLIALTFIIGLICVFMLSVSGKKLIGALYSVFLVLLLIYSLIINESAFVTSFMTSVYGAEVGAEMLSSLILFCSGFAFCVNLALIANIIVAVALVISSIVLSLTVVRYLSVTGTHRVEKLRRMVLIIHEYVTRKTGKLFIVYRCLLI